MTAPSETSLPGRRPARLLGLAALALAAALDAGAAAARPGSGYDPRARGLSQVHYYACLQYVGADGATRACPEIVKALDPTVDPFALPQSSPEFATAFDRRWGRPDPSKTPPDPGAFRRKKWAFMDNERGGLARAALEWACRKRPDLLGITAGEWSCEPTEREEIDFKALYDLSLLRAYFDAEVAGAGPDRPFLVSEPGKPCTYSAPDLWWYGWTLHYRNDRCGDTGTPPVVVVPGTPALPAETVAKLRELRRRLDELARWIDEQLLPAGPSTARVGVAVAPGPAGPPRGGSDGKP